MSTSFEKMIELLSAEEGHAAAINDCIVYFAALAETKRRGYPSDLFQACAAELPQDCDDTKATRIREALLDFVEKCPEHPLLPGAFRILRNFSVGDELKSFFVAQLRFHHGQGHAAAVFQLCIELEDLGLRVFRDEKGAFLQSRSSCEAETNMGVARRFLERQNAEQGGPT